MGELRDRMIKGMELRRLAASTQVAYLRGVEGLARHFGRAPDRMSGGEVKDYLHHLLVERKLGWSTVNVAAAGIGFFFTDTLGRPEVRQAIPPRRTPRRLPEILSREEIARLFEVTGNLKHRALLMTAYGGGLRVGELLNLRIEDVDSGRMMIRVRKGKGEKDRYTVLFPRLLEQLRLYWKSCRPERPWLFPGAKSGRSLCCRSAGLIYQKAKEKAGISKRGGIHTLRHCFATHLLEEGVDLRTIQLLMGHRSISTTIGYVQLTARRLETALGPLDLLDHGKPE